MTPLSAPSPLEQQIADLTRERDEARELYNATSANVAAYREAHIAAIARAQAAERERDEAIKLTTQYARELGEMQGRYDAAHWPGIVDEWKARALSAESKLSEAVRVLRPFAHAAQAFDDLPPSWALLVRPADYKKERQAFSAAELRAARAFLAQREDG